MSVKERMIMTMMVMLDLGRQSKRERERERPEVSRLVGITFVTFASLGKL
jgi:hypothetical protein